MFAVLTPTVTTELVDAFATPFAGVTDNQLCVEVACHCTAEVELQLEVVLTFIVWLLAFVLLATTLNASCPVLNVKLHCGCTVSDTLTLCVLFMVFGSGEWKTNVSVYAPGSRFWLFTVTFMLCVLPGSTVPEVTLVFNQFMDMGDIPDIPRNGVCPACATT